MNNVSSISDAVFHSRAVRSTRMPIENDPDPMVHQQLARLFFLCDLVDLNSKRVLEFGCGSGLNCDFLQRRRKPRAVLGFDVSKNSVELAKKQYSGLAVSCADACDPLLDLSVGAWDVVVSFEVLEHVSRMETFVKNIRRHLAVSGVAFISTPNRDVFSIGHEPSPVNREHVKELTREEFERLLQPHFSEIEIWGQRFKKNALLEAWKKDVRGKITQCQSGTRWQKAPSLREQVMHIPLVSRAYKNPVLRRSWKYLRWEVLQTIADKRTAAKRPYSFEDFEFSRDTSDALWFCALLKP
jgi:SAM-dependent methyltransferase